jgi:hypothetical protein
MKINIFPLKEALKSMALIIYYFDKYIMKHLFSLLFLNTVEGKDVKRQEKSAK